MGLTDTRATPVFLSYENKPDLKESDLRQDWQECFRLIEAIYPDIRPTDVSAWNLIQIHRAVRFARDWTYWQSDTCRTHGHPSVPEFVETTAHQAAQRRIREEQKASEDKLKEEARRAAEEQSKLTEAQAKEAAEDDALATAARELVAADLAFNESENARFRAMMTLRNALKPGDYRDDFGLPMVCDGHYITDDGSDGFFIVKIMTEVKPQSLPEPDPATGKYREQFYRDLTDRFDGDYASLVRRAHEKHKH